MSEAQDVPRLDDTTHAVAVLSLLLALRQHSDPTAPESWVYRRVERLEIIDENSIRQRWSIEFALPEQIAGVSTTELRCVPLTWFERDNRMRERDLRDEQGSLMPIATQQESDELMALALADLALYMVQDRAAELRREVPPRLAPSVSEDLRHIALHTAAWKDAINRFKNAARMAVDRDTPGESFERAVIGTYRREGHSAGLLDILDELSNHFVVLAVLSGAQAQHRRILTMSWTDHANNKQGLFKWIASRMGWASVMLHTSPVNVGSTRYYEIEMASPSDDVEVVQGEIIVGAYDRSAGPSGPVGELTRRQWVTEKRDDDDRDPCTLQFSMTGLVTKLTGLELKSDASFLLEPAAGGFMRLALLTCTSCLVLLAIGRTHLQALELQIESAATLLLVIPGLLSLYVVRPGEHRLATDLYSGARCMVITAAFCVLAAGTVLVVDIDPGWLRFWWSAVCLLASLAWLAMVVATVSTWVRKLRRAHGPPPIIRTQDPAAKKTETSPSGRWKRMVFDRAAQTVALYAFVCVVCVGAAWLWSGGQASLSIAGRFEAAVADAATSARPGASGSVELWSIAGFPWTRMYIFPPATSRDSVVSSIGGKVAAAGSEIPEHVDADEALLVFIKDGHIVDVADLAVSRVDVRKVNGACPLTPDDVLRVSQSREISPAPGTQPGCKPARPA